MNVLDIVEKYLESTVDDSVKSWGDMPSFKEIPNINNAVKRLQQAFANNEHIFFVHDSDADGVGSAALAKSFVNGFDYKNVTHRITKREEGYGFLPFHVDEASEKQARLIVTTDNGITSKQATDYAVSKGIDVIVTDHHQAGSRYTYPDKAIIVNPQIIDGDHKLKDISGTFVFWYVIEAFYSTMLSYGYRENLDLLALTTVSDVMPLRHVNRFIVKEGLEKFNNPDKPFTKIIYKNNKYDPIIKAETLAFSVAPLLNAANRFSLADAAYQFLISNSELEAEQWFRYLESLNEHRKTVTNQYVKALDQHNPVYGKLVYVNLNNVVHGILGIISGKMAEKYSLPAITTATLPNGNVKGSGRSIGQLDLLDIVKKSSAINFAGGHKQAFGVELPYNKINDFVKDVSKQLSELPPEMFKEPDESFMDLDFKYINQDLYDLINRFEPFGAGYPKPVFGADVEVVKSNLFGKLKNHTAFVVRDKNGEERRMVMFFEQRRFKPGQKLRINFTIEYDSWENTIVGRIAKII